jgi:hypothetical protein
MMTLFYHFPPVFVKNREKVQVACPHLHSLNSKIAAPSVVAPTSMSELW